VKPPATPPKNRRGDIHSSLSLTPLSAARRRPNPNINSDIDMPPSSAPTGNLTQVDPASEPDEIRAIWGTTVNLTTTMSTFHDFLLNFKPKYRVAHSRSLGLRPPTFSSPEEGEVPLYQTYLRRMRLTGETNLNLDMQNLLSYPPSAKLYHQLVKYPQEVVPAMDQVLKDLMLELAESDLTDGVDGMQGKEGEVEVAEIMARVYKVRPCGLPVGNMRDLNPSGGSFNLCGEIYAKT
jgi:DNA replication licensing factor MCM4